MCTNSYVLHKNLCKRDKEAMEAEIAKIYEKATRTRGGTLNHSQKANILRLEKALKVHNKHKPMSHKLEVLGGFS